MTSTRTAPDILVSAFGRSFLPQHDLSLSGELNAAAVQILRQQVADATQDGPVVILVDVTDVTVVTPSGLVGLLEMLRLARVRGGDLRLYGSSVTVLDAQTVARLTEVARVYGGREAAVEAGRRKPAQPVRIRSRRRAFHDRVARLQASLVTQARDGVLFPALDGIDTGSRNTNKTDEGILR